MSESNLFSNTKAGDPNCWPRQIARSFPYLQYAVRALLDNVDEANQEFAVHEFTAERERMVAEQAVKK